LIEQLGEIYLIKSSIKTIVMKRNKLLLEKRKTYVHEYVKRNSKKQMKVIINELVEHLFISEKTIYNILKQ